MIIKDTANKTYKNVTIHFQLNRNQMQTMSLKKDQGIVLERVSASIYSELSCNESNCETTIWYSSALKFVSILSNIVMHV